MTAHISRGPSPALHPVTRESTPSIVAARIREAIALGEIAPGSQLGEVEYAARLGVSRGPLREGLQRLTQEGLLVAHPNRGLFVVEMTDARVRDLYLARSAIERAAGGRIHETTPSAASTALLEVVDDMAAAAQEQDVREVSLADIRFHEVLVEHADSPHLSRIHATLLTETRMCIHLLEPTYAVDEARVGEHRDIALAFAGGDPRHTDALIVHHMQDALRRLTGSAAGSVIDEAGGPQPS
ncbi:Transcriptional regulator, GntR family [Serinicoccus hydrothermalis]|uniref:Transcriptional regulator, GntR family n=1 Tax=Serinicoccus hydrothermalis TaxID=1758689 RepID=A0A1B1N8P0_9MICO|nr:GntR family transcriptional regulator [Serinicoccus hydrothermalis]ANS77803.1 Transcriptional regulator, GntR family [Serinicoccus hydrothermalis]